MQTFLPYADFQKSVEVLDYRRLGKQRVEAKQILNALEGRSKGWVNHPAAKMWRGYEAALRLYMNICIKEWVRRGYKNSMPLEPHDEVVLPPWFGNLDFHRAHQSNLVRKDPEFYGSVFPDVSPDLPYIWPV